MEFTVNPNSKTGKALFTALILLLVVCVVYIVYKIVFQFKNSEVRNYINAEAAKTGDPVAAAKILKEGCDHILASRTLTNQVLESARYSGIPREQELVHVALMEAYAKGFIEQPNI
jgi:hypothetical protein